MRCFSLGILLQRHIISSSHTLHDNESTGLKNEKHTYRHQTKKFNLKSGKAVNQKATETEEGHLVATQPLQQQLAIAKKG